MSETRDTFSDLAKKQQVPEDHHPNDSVFQLQADLALENLPATRQTPDDTADRPDGGYGWVCVATCFIVNSFTWGVVAVSPPLTYSWHYLTDKTKSYGVYLSYYLSAQTFPGSQPLDYAFIGGLNFGFAMVVSPIVTVLARIWGIHVAMLIGTVVLSGGFISASFATSIVHLYITQGAMVGLGVGFIYIPSVAVLAQWFHRRRSLANGISAAGSGIGGLIFSLATGPMIQNIGYKWSLRTIGMLTFVANLLATTFIRDRNAAVRPSQLAFDVKLLRRYDVLLLLSWAFFSMLGYMVLLFSLSDFAISIGLSRTQADQLTAFLNLGTAIGRPWVGVASDRFGRIEVAGGLTLLCGVLVLAMWVASSNFGLTVVFALISGAILGVYWVVSICPSAADGCLD